MKVLVACEYSGIVRDAFRARGHDAMSCDILPTETEGPHYEGDVRDLLGERFDLVVAHPPCTYLSNSGVSWLHRDETRWAKMYEAAEFFSLMFEFDSPRIAVENPIQHKYAVEAHGRGRQTQTIHPWQFGHAEQKATGLWLRGLEPLRPTENVKEQMMRLPKRERQRLHYLPPGPDRWKLRSATFQGFADAMADQWSVDGRC